jgi:hypothetical protein
MQITDLLNNNKFFIDGKLSFKSQDAEGNQLKEIEYVEVIATTPEVDSHGEIVDFSFLEVDSFKGVDCKIEHSPYKTVGAIDSENIVKTDKEIRVGVYLNKKSRYYKEANEGLLSGQFTGASIGSLVTKQGNVLKTKSVLELSLVSSPANNSARVLSFKSDNNFLSTLKPAPLNYKSSYAESLERVKKHYNAINEPNEDYKNCFLIKSESNTFDSICLLAVDIINGEPMLLTKKSLSYVDTLEQINSDNVKNLEKDLTIIKNKHQELLDREKAFIKSEIDMVDSKDALAKFIRINKSIFPDIMSNSNVDRLIDQVKKSDEFVKVEKSANEVAEESVGSDNSTNSLSQVNEKKSTLLKRLAEVK